jgi:carboxypeptidase Q
MLKIAFIPAFYLLTCLSPCFSQDTDSLAIRKIYTEALTDNTAYKNLEYLCTGIGGRLCGSPQAEKAVEWARHVMEGMGLDTVYLQETSVRHWVRGDKEEAIVNRGKASGYRLHACALGGSVGTGEKGLSAKVIEVKEFDELAKLGREKIAGKIVFFNHPADPSFYMTFQSYGGAVGFRARGAVQAARYGAIAAVVRSATIAHDNFPHTGIMHYADTVEKIPAIAISTNDADKLSSGLKNDPGLTLFIRLSCKELPEVISYNVIGEIKGTDHPDQIIAFGGHLDSWDLGQGAHDDGSGVIQSIEVLRLFKALHIRPKHTLRGIAFMDEETEQRGAKRYTESAQQMINARNKLLDQYNGDSLLKVAKYKQPAAYIGNHIAAIEADRGGSTPFGFSIDASDTQLKKVQGWKNLLQPYGLYFFEKGGSGVDVSGLKKFGVPVIGLVTDSQRYFDYHHSGNDTFDKVNERELQLGSASIGALVYLIDIYGL